ncbi:MAG: hypothetical protein L0J02_12430 [Tetragenococcus koreensis]|nr:hypothetical protein [Tetragenococcus koreensis]
MKTQKNLDYELGISKKYGAGIYYGLEDAMKSFPSCSQFFVIERISDGLFIEDTMKLDEYYTTNFQEAILFYNRNIANQMKNYTNSDARVRTVRKSKGHWELIPLNKPMIEREGIKVSDFVKEYNLKYNQIMNIAGEMQRHDHIFKRGKNSQTRYLNQNDMSMILEILKNIDKGNSMPDSVKMIINKKQLNNNLESESLKNEKTNEYKDKTYDAQEIVKSVSSVVLDENQRYYNGLVDCINEIKTQENLKLALSDLKDKYHKLEKQKIKLELELLHVSRMNARQFKNWKKTQGEL